METEQFAVGQVWKDRGGNERNIFMIGSPDEQFCVYSEDADGTNYHSHTASGAYYLSGENVRDLVELVTNADSTPAQTGQTAGFIKVENVLPVERTPAYKLQPATHGIMDVERTAFIDNLVHGLFIEHWESRDSSDISEAIRTAVKLRDELVAGSQAE